MPLNTVFLPPATPSKKLLVVLHGRGDSHQGFTWLPRALGFTDLGYLLVDAPDDWYGGFSWYDLPPRQLAGILRSRDLLDELFAKLLAEGWSTDQMALFGFSQGCLMTLEWGARSEHALAAYVGVSGYVYNPAELWEEMHPQARREDWLVTHGRQDEVLPFSETEDQVAWLKSMGLPITFRAYDKTHTIDPEHELAAIRAFLAERLGLKS